MIYVILNSDLYFHLPLKIENEFINELESIITLCKLLDRKCFVRKPSLEEKIASSMSVDRVFDCGKGDKLFFCVAFNGFIKSIIHFKDTVEIKYYNYSNQLDAIKDFKKIL